MVAVLYAVLKVEKVGKVDLNEEKLVINEEVKERAETTKMKGYRNIALFGVDSTTCAGENTRSDTIMIASINLDTGDCKLVSVYRDTYLNLSNDTYNKCNAAYMKGGTGNGNQYAEYESGYEYYRFYHCRLCRAGGYY